MGPQAAPLFLFLFSLTLLRILLAFELKSTSSLKKKDPTVLPAVFKCGVMAAELSGVEGRQMERAKKTNPHYTWLRCMSGSLSERRQSEKNISNVCVCVWAAVFEMTSGDRGVVLVCVTAGAVFLWRTERSALPLRLVINGYRFITSSQSAMLPACPTLLVTQSDW